jgi:alkylated DNA nucleotide flippase Atl1
MSKRKENVGQLLGNMKIRGAGRLCSNHMQHVQKKQETVWQRVNVMFMFMFGLASSAF